MVPKTKETAMLQAPPTKAGTLRLAAGAVLISALMTGCSGPRSEASPGPSRSPKSTSPTPTLTERAAAERRALLAYRGMWNAFVHAGRTSNSNDPLLAKYTSGDALQTITTALRDARKRGEVLKGNLTVHPKVTDVTPTSQPTQVTIHDCTDDSHWLAYRATGGLVNDKPGGKHSVTAIVVDNNGWKVSAFAAHGVGSCT